MHNIKQKIIKNVGQRLQLAAQAPNIRYVNIAVFLVIFTGMSY